MKGERRERMKRETEEREWGVHKEKHTLTCA